MSNYKKYSFHSTFFNNIPCPIYYNYSQEVLIDISSSVFKSCKSVNSPGAIFCFINAGSILLTRVSFIECACSSGNIEQVFSLCLSNFGPCAVSLFSVTDCGINKMYSYCSKISAETTLENSNFSKNLASYEPSIKLVNNNNYPIAALYTIVENCTAAVDTIFSMYGMPNILRAFSSFCNIVLQPQSQYTYIRFAYKTIIDNSNFGNINCVGYVRGTGILTSCWIDKNVEFDEIFSIEKNKTNPTSFHIIIANELIQTAENKIKRIITPKVLILSILV